MALKSTEKAVLRKVGADGLFTEIMQNLQQEGMNWSWEGTWHERHLGNNILAQMVINMWKGPPKTAAIAVTIHSLKTSYTSLRRKRVLQGTKSRHVLLCCCPNTRCAIKCVFNVLLEGVFSPLHASTELRYFFHTLILVQDNDYIGWTGVFLINPIFSIFIKYKESVCVRAHVWMSIAEF